MPSGVLKEVCDMSESFRAKRPLYAELLGFSRGEPDFVIRRIEEGVSMKQYESLLRSTRFSQKEIQSMASLPSSTLARRKKEGRFNAEESDRLVRTAKVFSAAVGLFEGDHAAAAQWMRSPAKALGDVTPIEFSKTSVGTSEVEKLIGRLEYGVFA